MAGLAVVPALEIANADSDIQLLKKGGNGKGKGNCNSCGDDFIIDEPVIKLQNTRSLRSTNTLFLFCWVLGGKCKSEIMEFIHIYEAIIPILN